ncbi:uncharacterized protein LOC143362148 [Halictus rubicundus]|uniref:uncharacterized protein LOC143362148 n=1 Tax=Halictus rubicundus TaxID=77578 RepID=UPI004035F86E
MIKSIKKPAVQIRLLNTNLTGETSGFQRKVKEVICSNNEKEITKEKYGLLLEQRERNMEKNKEAGEDNTYRPKTNDINNQYNPDGIGRLIENIPTIIPMDPTYSQLTNAQMELERDQTDNDIYAKNNNKYITY